MTNINVKTLKNSSSKSRRHLETNGRSPIKSQVCPVNSKLEVIAHFLLNAFQ